MNENLKEAIKPVDDDHASKEALLRQSKELALAATLEFRARLTGKNGTYRVLQSLGSGGNSAVYLVEANNGPYRGVLFALKLFLRVTDDDRRQRFDTEVQFLGDCDHPSIMRAFDFGEHHASVQGKYVAFPFLIAEYLPKTLRKSMMAGLSIVEKVAFTLQLLSALAYLSAKEPAVVHRDIKPENIFVKGRSAVLGDFGLLKAGDGLDPSVEYHIQDSSGIRFPRLYPTPDLIEYCKNRQAPSPLTPKSDVFQLGLVLAELFTGEVPMKPRSVPFSSIELIPVGPISGNQGEAIRGYINTMLNMDVSTRPNASDLFDSWEGSFLRIADSSRQLEDQIFST